MWDHCNNAELTKLNETVSCQNLQTYVNSKGMFNVSAYLLQSTSSTSVQYLPLCSGGAKIQHWSKQNNKLPIFPNISMPTAQEWSSFHLSHKSPIYSAWIRISISNQASDFHQKKVWPYEESVWAFRPLRLWNFR